MKRKMLIAGIVIAALLPLFFCLQKQNQVKGGLSDVRQQIKTESMIQ